MDKFLVKKIFFFFTVLATGFLLNLVVSNSALAYAYHAAPIDDSYNTTLISDAAFTAKDTMTTEEIQAFLVLKMPSCDTWGQKYIYDSEKGYSVTRAQYSLDRGVSTPFVCLRDYSEGGKSAAQIIKDAANDYDINPQVILVTLEKEQSLVRDDWPWQWNYNRAMGMACPDTGGCDAAFAGFTNQVKSGSRLLKAVYNKSCNPSVGPFYEFDFFNTFRGIPRVLGDGVLTNIDTCATAALYQYTPYRPDSAWIDRWYVNPITGVGSWVNYYGNYNFVTLFKDWFSEIRFSNLVFSNYWPARGETYSMSYQLTNNTPKTLTISNAGIVGRLNGGNADFGWKGPVEIAPWGSITVESSILLKETGSFKVTPCYIYNNTYYYVNQYADNLTVRYPEIMVISLPKSNINSLILGQSVEIDAIIQNNEKRAISFDMLGIYGRINGNVNDVGWSSDVKIEPNNLYIIKGLLSTSDWGTLKLQIGYYEGNTWGLFGDPTYTSVTQPNFSISNLLISNLSPARGEEVSVYYELTNNSGSSLSLQNVGIFARNEGDIIDFGWDGGATLDPGSVLPVGRSFVVPRVGSLSITPGYIYSNRYYFITSHGVITSSRYPNILVAYLPSTVPSNPIYGQTVNMSAVIKNLEDRPIFFPKVGIYGRMNGEIIEPGWENAVTIGSKDTYIFSKDLIFPSPGQYSAQMGYYAGNIWGKFGDVSIITVR